MLRLANIVILSWGWKRRLIALGAGAAGALAMPPFDFAPALCIPLMAAVWLIDGAARGPEQRGFPAIRDAAGAGWWVGYGYFLAGLWWLGSAFLVEADKFLWALPIAVGGMPAGLALFTAGGFALARVLWSPGAGRILALATGLGAAEWIRGTVFTGFPWNEFGMALGGNLVLAQISSLAGLYGLNFLAVAIFAAPATLIDGATGTDGEPARRPLWRSPTGWAGAALAAIAIFGAARLGAGPSEFEPSVKLRIMQPNLPQDEKFRPENKDRILSHYLSLSDRATSPQSSGAMDATHLIWPESAFPFILSRDPASLARIGALLGDTTTLITGAARIGDRARGDLLPGETQATYHNSIQVIGKAGVILDTYDKVHLVPFGEYLPFSGFLTSYGIRHLVHIPGGFTPGALRKSITAPKLPAFAPLVCYEAIFPGEALAGDGKSDRPGFMLNLTNDAWFGHTPGPYQHFAQARLRSIEEGLPLVRAANTGISAIIDAHGRIISQLPLGVEGVLDGALPKRIEATFFSKNPFLGSSVLFLLMIAGALFAKLRS